MAKDLTGGCLCGAVRYRTGGMIRAGYCHCRMCQKASGAPVVAWAVVPRDSFAFTQGTPVEYRSSTNASRLFCGTCGSPLIFREHDSGELDINLATLDEPERVVPSYHIYTASQQPWLHIADEAPRFATERPT
ncbi:MAG TPA: GFA family protein [Stellaceae bacterium]|nr:GFA family protein [Stellaceae bacterium]